MSRSSEYYYSSPDPSYDDQFLWEAVRGDLLRHAPPPASVLEVGCGNGVNARRMAELGYSVTAIDSSVSGIEAARRIDSTVRFEASSIYDPLADRFGTFDVVVALEVIEHLYDPRALARGLHDLLKPGGHALLSTPYHGWLKNVLIALTGRSDDHFNPLWDHGHIKFFSVRSLRRLFSETPLREIHVRRLGRIPWLARTMLVALRRPLL